MTKKFFIALVCAMTLAFAACSGKNDPEVMDLSLCDNTVEKCWELTYMIAYASETTYAWGTEYQIVSIIKETQSMNGGIGTWSYKETSITDEDTCDQMGL